MTTKDTLELTVARSLPPEPSPGEAGAVPAHRPRLGRREPLGRRPGVLLGVVLATVLQLVPHMPDAPRTLAGLWLLFGAPIVLWWPVARRVVTSATAMLLLSVGFTVITDMAVALTVNTGLPPLGVDRPLTRPILTIATAVALVVLNALGPADTGPTAAAAHRDIRSRWEELKGVRGIRPVGILGAFTLVLSVAGPIRLDNGLGGSVSVVAVIAVVALLTLLLLRRGRYPVPVLELGLYCAAAALLLLTCCAASTSPATTSRRSSCTSGSLSAASTGTWAPTQTRTTRVWASPCCP